MNNLYIDFRKPFLSLIIASSFVIFSCKTSSSFRYNDNIDYKIKTKENIAGTPPKIKEKVSPDLYDSSLDKAVQILDDTVQIPTGISEPEKQKYNAAQKEFEDQIGELKKQDNQKQTIIKYSGILLQKFWQVGIKGAANKGSKAKYNKNFNVNTHLKNVTINDANWSNFVQKYLTKIFDVLIKKEMKLFKNKDIFEGKEEETRNTIIKCINKQNNLSNTYFEICKKNREQFVDVIFNPKKEKNYFLGLLHYITKKIGDLLDNLNTFGDLKNRLIRTTKNYEKLDPEGQAAYGLLVFLKQTKKMVLDQVNEAIDDKRNTGIIKNLNGLYEKLNSIGYVGMRLDLKLFKHIKSNKVDAVVEMFKVYIDIIHRILNKFKMNISKFLKEFVGNNTKKSKKKKKEPQPKEEKTESAHKEEKTKSGPKEKK